MTDQLQLWGGGTARTFRAHWMLQELGLTYDTHLIGPRTGETQTDSFRRLNPKEKIPVLVDGALLRGPGTTSGCRSCRWSSTPTRST